MEFREHDIYPRFPTPRLWSRALAAVCVAVIVIGATGTAEAGHYYIRDLGLYSLDLIIKLRDNGVQTTEHFLARTTTPEGRKELATQTGMDEAEVLSFAKTCEFLQIDGVGPKVVTLLNESGVVDLADMAKRNPADLHARMVAVNRVQKITGVDPPVELVEGWVNAAKKVKYRVAQ